MIGRILGGLFKDCFSGILFMEKDGKLYSGMRMTFQNSMENETFEVSVKVRRFYP